MLFPPRMVHFSGASTASTRSLAAISCMMLSLLYLYCVDISCSRFGLHSCTPCTWRCSPKVFERKVRRKEKLAALQTGRRGIVSIEQSTNMLYELEKKIEKIYIKIWWCYKWCKGRMDQRRPEWRKLLLKKRLCDLFGIGGFVKWYFYFILYLAINLRPLMLLEFSISL